MIVSYLTIHFTSSCNKICKSHCEIRNKLTLCTHGASESQVWPIFCQVSQCFRAHPSSWTVRVLIRMLVTRRRRPIFCKCDHDNVHDMVPRESLRAVMRSLSLTQACALFVQGNLFRCDDCELKKLNLKNNIQYHWTHLYESSLALGFAPFAPHRTTFVALHDHHKFMVVSPRMLPRRNDSYELIQANFHVSESILNHYFL